MSNNLNTNLNNISQEEKINYIYRRMKAQQSVWFLKIFIKVFIIIGMIFYVSYIVENMDTQDFREKVTWNISKVVTPLVNDILKDVSQDSQNNISKEYIEEYIRTNPDILTDMIKNNDN